MKPIDTRSAPPVPKLLSGEPFAFSRTIPKSDEASPAITSLPSACSTTLRATLRPTPKVLKTAPPAPKPVSWLPSAFRRTTANSVALPFVV